MQSTNDSRAKTPRKKAHGGFTLIELLIVVSIILILAALALPSLLRSREAANQASAVADIRTIVTGGITYDSTYGNYATTLVQIGGAASVTQATCEHAQLIDIVLGGADPATKSGYKFSMFAGNAAVTGSGLATGCTTNQSTDGFGVMARPIVGGTTGQRSYCGDGSGEIHFDETGAAFTFSNALCSAGTGLVPQ